MSPNPNATPHKIEVSYHYSSAEGKYIISIKGITSGMKVNASDADNITISFKLDGSRFRPQIIT